MAEPGTEDGTQTSQTFIQYVRERDEARELVKVREKELQQSRSSRYELSKKCEQLEDQVKYLKSKLKEAKHELQANNTETSFSNLKKKPTPKLKPVKKQTRQEKASKQPKIPTLHPIIPNREEIADDSNAFYSAISELCPHTKLSVIKNAEKLFLEGDTNGDGLIDVDELDTLFTKHLALYTKQEVKEILETGDTDGSGALDFIEILQVMHEMDQGEENPMPKKGLQKNSKGTVICSIQ